MNSISLGDAEETGAKGTEDDGRDPLVRMFEVVLEESDSGRASGSRERGVVRPFLLVDLGAVLSYVRGNRAGPTAAVEETLRTATDEVGRRSEGIGQRSGTGERESDEGGRGVISKLFVLGAVVGISYALSKRSGSADEIVDEATDRAQSAADETAMRSGEVAGRTETVAERAATTIEQGGEMVAERIRQSSETAADRVEESGEQAADQIEEAGETVENVEEEAAESAEGMTGEDEESEE